MDVGASFGQYTVLAALRSGKAPSDGIDDALIAQWAAEAGFARLVVIKNLFPVDERARHNVHLEAMRKAASLHHPNVRQIHELGSTDGGCYLAVEYLEGVTFDTLLRSRGRAKALGDPRLFAALLAQACEGLHHAHSRPRLLHGALRPDKLFVTSGGTVKILGLGLADLAAATAPAATLAKPSRYSYTAPEQILGRRADARTDVFAVGVIAWEALTGRRLFSRPSRVEVYRAITEKPIPNPRALTPAIPASLDRAVARALSSDPNERYKTAREFGLALEAGVSDHGSPLSTVAIASIIDRCFAPELEQQRSVVQRARQSLASADGDEDIFEVPTRLYEGGFETSNATTQMPPEELERLTAVASENTAEDSPRAIVASESPPSQLISKSARATPGILNEDEVPMADPAPAPHDANSEPPLARGSSSTIDSDVFRMPSTQRANGAVPGDDSAAIREFERPLETLSDIGDAKEVAAALTNDFEPVPTGSREAPGAADPTPNIKKEANKTLIFFVVLLAVAVCGALAYYKFVVDKAEVPTSPVTLE